MRTLPAILVALACAGIYCLMFPVTACCAQQAPDYGVTVKQSPDHGGANAVEDKLSPEPQGPQQKIGPVRSEFEYFLSGGVLVFAAIIIALEVWVIVRENKGWGTNATRIVIVTIIIMAALFLITAGYSQRQIGPVMGLLGTIAGYVLGKSETARVPS